MNAEELTLMMIKGSITELPEEEQKKVKDCAEKIREVVREYDACGQIAVALIGAEMAAGKFEE